MEIVKYMIIKKQIKKTRYFIYLFVLPLILLLALFVCQQTAGMWSYKRYPAVGKFVDVGGYNIHLYAMGETGELPTVVLESGLPTPASYVDWRLVQENLSNYTRVISYDRAGYGWSDAAHNDRTSRQLASDLREMLHAAGEEGPFLLVGHSFGGYTSKVFAHDYADDTAGIILLDPASPDLHPPVSASGLKMQQLMRQLGLLRLFGSIGLLPLPEAVMGDRLSRDFLYRSYCNQNQISEFMHMVTTSAWQVREVTDIGLGRLPVIIVSSYEKEKDYPDWLEKQADMLVLSSRTEHILNETAGHFIHFDQPQFVTGIILELLERIRSGADPIKGGFAANVF